MDEQAKEMALNEIRVMASIDHPNICAFHEAFVDMGAKSLCLTMAYADGADLGKKIGALREEKKFMKEKEIWTIFI